MERDRHGHIIRPFTNDRKIAVLEFRDGGYFTRAGKLGRANWRQDLYNFFHRVKGDRKVTQFNLLQWVRPHYNAIDVGDWSWCTPDLAEDLVNFFEGPEEEIQNQDVAVPQVPLIPEVDHLPPEMWAAILDNLLDPEDVQRGYSAHPLWREILHSGRVTWLLHYVLPHLLEYLTKEDFLHCRQVCKRWCLAIDYFLENNAANRPTFQDQQAKSFTGEKFNRTDRSQDWIVSLLQDKHLDGILINQNKAIELLDAVTRFNYTNRSPIIGKCAKFIENAYPPQEPMPSTLEFFQGLGRNLSTLTLSLDNFAPMDIMPRTLELLTHTPNLRSLILIIRAVLPLEGITRIQADQQLNEYWRNGVSEYAKRNLPKLEFLFLSVDEFCEIGRELHEALLKPFLNNQLEALRVVAFPSEVQLENLIELNCTLTRDEQILRLLQLNSPLQKLIIIFIGRINPTVLFEAIKTFSGTLKTLHLCINADPEPEIPKDFRAYYATNSIVTMDGIITFQQEQCLPPSFNFIVGLASSLRFFYFILSDEDIWQAPNLDVNGANFPPEILDLQNHLQNALATGNLNLYGSNIWTFFPKLLSVTVELEKARIVPTPPPLEQDEEQPGVVGIPANAPERETHYCEFRRDMYEKLQNANM